MVVKKQAIVKRLQKFNSLLCGSCRCMGRKLSQETKTRMSTARMGHFVSDETREKIGKIRRGKHFTDEQKLQLSLAHKGKKASEETRQRMSISQKKRMTIEEKQKLSAYHKGKKLSDETKRKISEGRKGSKHERWNPNRTQLRQNQLIAARCRRRLRSTIELFRQEKSGKSFEILGYTPKQLVEYITSHPNWNLVKNEIWEMDHIFPISAFVEYKIFELKVMHSLDNIQPITKLENLRKNKKYDKCEFEKWLVTKGFICGIDYERSS